MDGRIRASNGVCRSCGLAPGKCALQVARDDHKRTVHQGFRIQPPSRRPAPFVPAPLVPTSSITLVELEKRLAMHKKTRAWLIRTRQPTDWNDEIIAKVRKDLAAEVARLPRVFK